MCGNIRKDNYVKEIIEIPSIEVVHNRLSKKIYTCTMNGRKCTLLTSK